MKKRKKKSFEERANQAEAAICERFGLTPDEYLELWYETGCLFAETVFRDRGLTGQRLITSVALYITSSVFWVHWANQWLHTCEWFLYWQYKKKSIEDFKKMQLQASRPEPPLHKKIVAHGNTNYQQLPLAKTA